MINTAIAIVVVGHRRSMLTMVLNSISHSRLSAATHVAVQPNTGSADSSTDVAFVGSVAVRIAGEEWSFPACTLFHGSFGQVLLASLEVLLQGAPPSGAVSRKGFPVVRVHL